MIFVMLLLKRLDVLFISFIIINNSFYNLTNNKLFTYKFMQHIYDSWLAFLCHYLCSHGIVIVIIPLCYFN